MFIARSMQEALSVLLTVGRGVDIAELCGGGARTTTVAIRRNLVGGKNFDLVTHTDLGCPREQKATLRYLDEAFVFVFVLAPSCRSMGPMSHVSHVVNYQMWLRHYQEDAPHIKLCGTAAAHQLSKGRHFLCEQPNPTWLFHEPP